MGPLVRYCPLQEEEGKEGSEEDEEDEVDGEAYEEHEKEDDEDFAAVDLLEHQKFQNLQSAGDEVEGDAEEEGQQ